MALPQMSEDEVDDLIYLARAGEKDELQTFVSALAEREKVSAAEIIVAAKDGGKSTCLHMATGNGHLDIVKLLLEQFASRPKEEKQAFLDAPNEYGNTGLHWAALGGHLETVKLLMGDGASPALANDKNYVPLDLASFGEKFDIVDYFLEQSGMIEGGNEEGLGEAAAEVSLEDGEEHVAGDADAAGDADRS
ncbi:ankyrin [Phialemonium atrogriseum]|uniref:Ankyrin n=1 Tax=Phialemonium atrogriseum TaxID=1093897 RepID=A0AAJ0BZJ7_9PEZI|nr:ankyrin [Phialemonium atrogriseum]KAK1766323.1 ankyrin [Phialemonium atrogriseum]